MRRNPSNVAGGIAPAFATKTFAVKVASKKDVTPTVQIQPAVTTSAYLANWLLAGFCAAANTHQRFKQKWSATANTYASATAVKRGTRWTNNQIRQKSARATIPPTTQNRSNLFVIERIAHGVAIYTAKPPTHRQHNSSQGT